MYALLSLLLFFWWGGLPEDEVIGVVEKRSEITLCEAGGL